MTKEHGPFRYSVSEEVYKTLLQRGEDMNRYVIHGGRSRQSAIFNMVVRAAELALKEGEAI